MRIWWAYDAQSNANPFGRLSLGPCGWHDSQATAMAEAIKRYPNTDPSAIQVSAI